VAFTAGGNCVGHSVWAGCHESHVLYVLWFNRARFNSFRDTDNNPAVPYLLVFQTKGS